MKIFAFGDIHGEFFKLRALYERLNISTEDLLVFLGDYIDRGPLTFNVIDFLVTLDKKHKCIFLLGNHEDMFLNFLAGIDEDLFLMNGGYKTILSYELNGYDVSRHTPHAERTLPKSHMDFFRGLKLYHETEDYIFVHAGITPPCKLSNTSKAVLLWDRVFCYYGDNYVGKTVVFGHTPSANVLNEKHRICIDTGACFDSLGILTCVTLPDRVFTQQETVMEDLED